MFCDGKVRVQECLGAGSQLSSQLPPRLQRVFSYIPIRMLWMIWKMADPQTTKMNRARSHGPTPLPSVRFLIDLATFPRCVMFLLCFSFAILILCLATILSSSPGYSSAEFRVGFKSFQRFFGACFGPGGSLKTFY